MDPDGEHISFRRTACLIIIGSCGGSVIVKIGAPDDRVIFNDLTIHEVVGRFCGISDGKSVCGGNVTQM